MSIQYGLIESLHVLVPDRVSELSAMCFWKIPAVFALQPIRGLRQATHEGQNPELPFWGQGEERDASFLFLNFKVSVYS